VALAKVTGIVHRHDLVDTVDQDLEGLSCQRIGHSIAAKYISGMVTHINI
jgi:hypothetical protein